MLKLRIITALILIPLVILGIFFLPQWAFDAITAIIMLLAAWEWAAFFGWDTLWWRLLYISMILIVLIASMLLPPWVSFAIGSLWWLVAASLILSSELKAKIIPLPRSLIALTGFLALIPCWQALIVLHLNPEWLLLLLIIVWLADIIAYFAGRLFGKHKLAPTLSPNKTLEGAYIAFIVTAIGALAWELFLGNLKPSQIISWIGVILLTVVASIIGDLFESYLKRQCGLKDSGSLLPGHGGVLDRIDSLTAAAPMFICAIIFFRLL